MRIASCVSGIKHRVLNSKFLCAYVPFYFYLLPFLLVFLFAIHQRFFLSQQIMAKEVKNARLSQTSRRVNTQN